MDFRKRIGFQQKSRQAWPDCTSRKHELQGAPHARVLSSSHRNPIQPNHMFALHTGSHFYHDAAEDMQCTIHWLRGRFHACVCISNHCRTWWTLTSNGSEMKDDCQHADGVLAADPAHTQLLKHVRSQVGTAMIHVNSQLINRRVQHRSG